MTRSSLAIALLLLGPAGAAQAATLCASNGAELQAALNTAAGNGQADEIRLAIGTYDVPVSGTFSFSPAGTQDHDIEISGGWSEFFDNPCGQRFDNVDPFMTALQGDGSGRVMNIQPPADSSMDVTISRVAFIGGDAGAGEGGGLRVFPFAGATGWYRIDQCAFVGNSADRSAALRMIGGSRVEVRNSLFVANTATSNYAIELESFTVAGVYAIGNTILNNTVVADGAVIVGGLSARASDPAKMLIVNNLAWGNDGDDIRMNGNGGRWYRNNNADKVTGTSGAVVDGNLSFEPDFESGFFNYTPAEGSPLRDGGRTPPTFTPIPVPFESNWSTGTLDLPGRDRRQGATIDIGAYESRPVAVFGDGFE